MPDNAVVRLDGDNEPLNRALDDSESSIKQFGMKVGAALAAVGGSFLVERAFSWGKAWVNAAVEAQKNVKQLQLSIDNNDLGVTTDEIQHLGDQLQNLTKYTGSQIVANAKLLAGFDNVKGDIFKEAIISATDLSAATGRNLTSSIHLLGRSLSYPRYALEGLAKAGVTFTKDQERMIDGFLRVNDVASAQRVILQRLNETVGGQAATEVENAVGRWERFKNNVSDMGREVGEALLPVLDELSPLLQMATAWIRASADELIELTKTVIDGGKAVYEWMLTPWRVAQEAVVYAVTAIQTVMENWRDVMMIALKTVALAAVSTFNDIVHFLTVVVPTAVEWFMDNWRDIFTDWVNFTATVIANIIENFGNLFEAIQSYLSGDGFDFTWTPLLEGFKRTAAQFPEIAKRARTETEKELAMDIGKLGMNVGDRFNKNLKANMIAAFQDPEVDAAADDALDRLDPALDPQAAADAAARGRARGDRQARTALEDLRSLSKRITTAAATTIRPEDKMVEAQKEGAKLVKDAVDKQAGKVDKTNEKLDMVNENLKNPRPAVLGNG